MTTTQKQHGRKEMGVTTTGREFLTQLPSNKNAWNGRRRYSI